MFLAKCLKKSLKNLYRSLSNVKPGPVVGANKKFLWSKTITSTTNNPIVAASGFSIIAFVLTILFRLKGSKGVSV